LPPTPQALPGRSTLYGVDGHSWSELTERVAAYGELSIISALLVGAALTTLVDPKSSSPDDAEIPVLANIAEVSSAAVLACNIAGTAVILFQKHYALSLMSRNYFNAAREGWDDGKPQRNTAVKLISWSMPGLLLSGSFYVMSGEQITIGDWVSAGILLVCAALTVYYVLKIKADFARAEARAKLLEVARADARRHWKLGLSMMVSRKSPNTRTVRPIPLAAVREPPQAKEGQRKAKPTAKLGVPLSILRGRS
jgi:hypothetical protein